MKSLVNYFLSHHKNFLSHHKNFIKFIQIGAVNIFSITLVLWFFVDIIGYMAVWVNLPLSVVVFFGKFYVYDKTGLFVKMRRRNFELYGLISFMAMIISTLALWIFVDMLDFFVGFVNPVIVVVVTILRFELFKFFKMLEE